MNNTFIKKKVSVFLLLIFFFNLFFSFISSVNAAGYNADTIVEIGYADIDNDGTVDIVEILFDDLITQCDYSNSDWVINNAGSINISITGIDKSDPFNDSTGLCDGGDRHIYLSVTADVDETSANIMPNISYINNNNNLKDSGIITDKTGDVEDFASPVLLEVTPVPDPTGDKRPSYTFSSTETGTPQWGGSCAGYFDETSGSVSLGNNTFSGILDMPYGDYNDCTLIVQDNNWNDSEVLNITPFEISYCADEITTGISEDECNALIDFYDATAGDTWTDNTNWDTPSDVNTWTGVTATGGHVTELILNNNNLNGYIPIEIGDLLYLESLELGWNHFFTSFIPSEIGNLTNLIYLNLEHNDFSGNFPTWLGNLTNLEYLNLNEIFANLTNDVIPTNIGDLVNLEYLNIRQNGLIGTIPDELYNLINLVYLDITDNTFSNSTLSASIGNLVNLLELNFQNTGLTGTIPVEIGNMTSLERLDLFDNDLTGSLPTEIGNLSNLTFIDVNQNDLSGNIPISLGNLTNLLTGDFRANSFTGSLPTEISALTGSVLYFSENNLSGLLPELAVYLNPGYTGPNRLEVYGNNFIFEDLRLNYWTNKNGISNFIYKDPIFPDRKIDTTRTELYTTGSMIFITSVDQAIDNVYVWRKDGSVLSEFTGAVLTINSAVSSDSGVYTYEISNTTVTGLTLFSNPITIVVDDINPVIAEITSISTFTNDNTPSYTFSITETGSIDSWSGTCAPYFSIGALNAGNNTFTASVMSDGTYTGCSVIAKDVVGNLSNVLTLSGFTIDTINPSASVEYNPTFTTTGSVVASLTGVTESINVTNNGGLFSYTFSSNGSFVFEYEDQAGNTGSTTAIVNNIDNEVPLITIDSESLTLDSDTYFIYGTVSGGTGGVVIDGGSGSVTASIGTGGLFEATITLVQNSVNTLVVSAQDTVGNVGTGSVLVTESGSTDEFEGAIVVDAEDLGFVATASGSITATDLVIINQPIDLGTGSISVVLSSGTEITTSGTGTFDATAIATSAVSTVTGLDSGENVEAAIEFGLGSVGLLFSNPVMVQIPVPGVTTSTIKIKVKHGGTTTFVTTGLTNDSNATCTDGVPSVGEAIASVAGEIATIYTCAASEFAAYTETVVTTTTSSSGGGGGSHRDNCINGDFSGSSYDGICGEEKVVKILEENIKVTKLPGFKKYESFNSRIRVVEGKIDKLIEGFGKEGSYEVLDIRNELINDFELYLEYYTEGNKVKLYELKKVLNSKLKLLKEKLNNNIYVVNNKAVSDFSKKLDNLIRFKFEDTTEDIWKNRNLLLELFDKALNKENGLSKDEFVEIKAKIKEVYAEIMAKL